MPLTRARARSLSLSIAVLAAGLWSGSTLAVDLMDVYTTSLQRDPVFRSAGAGNRAAQEFIPQARAGLLPEVAFGASAGRTNREIRQPAVIATSDDFSPRDMSLSITQPLYRRDRWIAIGQAESLVRQSDVSYAAARQDLMIRVADRYFRLLNAGDDVNFATGNRDAIRQQLEQAQQRFEVGLIAITDVESAKARYDLANATVIEAESNLNNANEALREITGEYYDHVEQLAVDLPLLVPEPNDIDIWAQTALQQNLEIQAANEVTLVARDEIQRVEAGHLPTLDLVGSHRRTNDTPGSFAGTNTWTTTLALQLNVPIYQGGAVISRTRESVHLHQQTLDDLESVRRAVQRQTHDSFLGVLTGIARVGALKQARISNEAALEAVKAGFDVGTRTSVDVLDAQRDLLLALRDYAQARYLYILDILLLKQAAGTLSEDDLVEVNGWLR